MNEHILAEVTLLLAVTVIAVALLRRVKAPPILAYLSVGMAIGPYGLGLVSNIADIRFLAEFGVVFLLFTVGLEFSLPQLMAMRSTVLGLGGLQVLLTLLIVTVIALLFNVPWQGALIIGGALAMSSTAIAVKQLAEQLELHSRHGRLSLSILLFQDLAVVPLIIMIPALAGNSEQGVAPLLLWALLKGALVGAVMLAVGRWWLRPLFHEIASAHSAELFTLTVLLLSLAAAWLTDLAGLSLALGAFLAGMMLGETEYRHQVETDIRPFRDVLLGLFFVTIGMLLDITALPSIFHWVILLVFFMMTLKTFTIMGLAMLWKHEMGVALRTGLSLAQGGEFGFALLSLALAAGLLGERATQIVLAAIILSMMLGPLLLRYNGAIAKHFCTRYLEARHGQRQAVAEQTHQLSDHVMICGFGRIGQTVARFLEQEGFHFVALDLDPRRLREAHAAGEPVFYGDCTHAEILTAAGLMRARILVISFDDPRATSKILLQARKLRQDIPILVRARDDSNLERFTLEGATEVVPETLEAGLTLASHLLLLLEVPVAQVVRKAQDVRARRYHMLRRFFHGEMNDGLEGLVAQREGLHTIALPPQADAIDKNLGDMALHEMAVVVTAVRRANGDRVQPRGSTRLHVEDTLILYGTPENIARAATRLLQGK